VIELIEDLFAIDSELRDFVDRSTRPEIDDPLEKLREVAEDFGKAWSGSPLGPHACVYYSDFRPPPPSAHFSVERGLKFSRGDWHKYDPQQVENLIREKAGNPDLKIAHELREEGEDIFDDKLNEIVSILQIALTMRQDDFISNLKEKAEGLKISTDWDFVISLSQGRFISGDSALISDQKVRVAPHIAVMAEVFFLQDTADVCDALADITKRAASHLTRVERSKKRSGLIGTNVFIGHGRSLLWKDLKDFVQDRLKLPWDEFNRVPMAGITNIARLSEMLDAAAIAFLVMTGEDEQADGKLNARMNVVHEAGLFQGRLGFTRAIVLLEEGCEEFSNIQGLGQIRFPKGNIKAVFEEVREVLEREGVIES